VKAHAGRERERARERERQSWTHLSWLVIVGYWCI